MKKALYTNKIHSYYTKALHRSAFFIFTLSIFYGACAQAQQIIEKYHYENDFLPISFHVNNREKLRALLPEKSIALFFSNPEYIRSNDVYFEYHQDPNFFYLTGFNEPNSVLIITKETIEFDSIQTNEILFVPEKSFRDELWNGKRLGTNQAQAYTKIVPVYANQTLADFNFEFERFSKVLISPNMSQFLGQDHTKDRGDLPSMYKHIQTKTKQLSDSIIDRALLKEYMGQLREIKSPEEISLMQKAILITCKAQKELMRAIIPGKKEYSAEAIVEYVFKEEGAEHPGYPSILGSGENSCVLHYTSNRKILDFDDLLVSDVGAEYHQYTADITRTIPVSGKFSDEQKTIYNIVLEAQLAGIAACKKGNKFWQAHEEAKKIIIARLTELQIIKEPSEYKKYFMHGTSHYLGLDVHDAGTFQFLKPGNVITVEPGIYIAEGSDCDPKWWNIGIRIEDDVLITDGEPEVLSDCVPKNIEEIERLMKEKSIFNKYK